MLLMCRRCALTRCSIGRFGRQASGMCPARFACESRERGMRTRSPKRSSTPWSSTSRSMASRGSRPRRREDQSIKRFNNNLTCIDQLALFHNTVSMKLISLCVCSVLLFETQIFQLKYYHFKTYIVYVFFSSLLLLACHIIFALTLQIERNYKQDGVYRVYRVYREVST